MDKKIAFVICYNNERYLDECCYYINKLEIPEGYEVELLTISDAKSMTSAYNEAIATFDAKYKVYLHQDVFLLDKELLKKMLLIFEDETIGMIGVAGTKELPRTARASAAWNCGNVLVYNDKKIVHMMEFGKADNDVIDVEAIDGMLMITQYDIPWDEVIFDGWHFYDISQCMAFRENDLRIVIPKDESVWALHDSGISSEKGYDIYRKRFCEKYEKYGFQYNASDDTWYTLGHDELLSDMLEQEWVACYDNIRELEWQQYGASVVAQFSGIEEFREYYTYMRFLVWRCTLVCDGCGDASKELMGYLDKGILTMECLKEIVNKACLDPKEFWSELM